MAEPLNEAKLNAFVLKTIDEMGAALNAALAVIGDRLGLYKAMAGAGPLTAAQLAERTRTDERHIREWLNAQAAGGIVEYDAKNGAYRLPAEHAAALTDETFPMFLTGGFQIISSVFRDEPKLLEAYRTGKGLGWHEHDPALFEGTERFFRPNYLANLTTAWLPALEDVVPKLAAGARVADVGCGHGASTVLMAKAYPKSEFWGFDYHPASIERARAAAAKAGVAGRARFEVAPAKAYPGKDYDLVTHFDCLHDLGDPVGAARHVRETLKADGTWMLVEPFAHDRVEENLNPIGRVFYAASSLICTPASKAQEVGLALGAQAGEAKLREIALAGGFQTFRRATQTPFNLVFEAKP